MKHEVTTFNTKKMLAAEFKKAMMAKPVSKITVSEIAGGCGLNRKTFYYHFQDIYGLLQWMLEQEVVEVVRHFDLLSDAGEALRFLMGYVEANRYIIQCAYDTMGRSEIKRFFYADFIGVMRGAIDDEEKALGVRTEEPFKDALADFYTGAVADALIALVRDVPAGKRGKHLEDILLICQAGIPAALLAGAGR
ncbi:MAG: TetR family transcriptional regulator [Lachnospiraceae bacterium]|jgi:probable dihydroxyacetone kinase regulator|nr:TetR family transcriptional regulator [Lachnospiraceae bacterium]